MSSSRSDVVTKFVCSCVCVFVCPSLFFLLVSLKFLLVLKSFNGVSRLFKGCLKFKGSFKDILSCLHKVLRVFLGSLKGVSRKFKGCLKEVQLVCQRSFNGV